MCIERRFAQAALGALLGCLTLRASGSVILIDAPPGMHVVSSFDAPALRVVDFNQDGREELQFWTYPGGADACIGHGARLAVVTSRPDRPWGGLAPLSPGDIIGATLSRMGVSWYSGFPVDDVTLPVQYGVGGPLLDNEVDMVIENTSGITSYFKQGGIVGVEFQLADGPHYGWVEIVNDGTEPWGGTITRWAWETQPDTPIIAGMVPEPSGLLLTVGLLLPLWMRRTGREMPRASR